LVPATPALRSESAYWHKGGFTGASLAEVRL
jgi:hypothetical protein